MLMLESAPGTGRKHTPKVSIQFKLHAPHAKRVHVAGDFTNWATAARPLKRRADGTWITAVQLKPGRYKYKFLVDDDWLNDPAAAETEDDSFGGVNNLIEVKGL